MEQLIILAGLPGTGKTFVAEKLKKKLNAEQVNIDMVRRDYIKDKKYFEYNDEIFSDEERSAAHKKMQEIAKNLLSKNKTVILESGFSTVKRRQEAISCAIDLNKNYLLIEIICPEAIVKARLEKRMREKVSSSTAGYLVYKSAKLKYAPIKIKHFTVDTSGDVDEQIEQILARQ